MTNMNKKHKPVGVDPQMERNIIFLLLVSLPLQLMIKNSD